MSWGERSCDHFSNGASPCPVPGGPTPGTCTVNCPVYKPNGRSPDSRYSAEEDDRLQRRYDRLCRLTVEGKDPVEVARSVDAEVREVAHALAREHEKALAAERRAENPTRLDTPPAGYPPARWAALSRREKLAELARLRTSPKGPPPPKKRRKR